MCGGEVVMVGQQFGWRLRLKAWWAGYELPPAQRSSSRRNRRSETAHAESLFWSADRIELVERVWGAGFHTPGGEDHLTGLIKPLGLDETMSVLDLGAGLGGATRLMARSSGAWVTGLEADQVLVEAGMERSRKAGLEKRAPVLCYDPEHVSLDMKFDCIFSKEAFFTVKEKDGLFESMAAHTKPGGQLLFTDYVLRHSASLSRATEVWREAEERRPYPWTVSQVQDRLGTLHYDIRIAEDITETYIHQILHAWADLTSHLPEKKADADTAESLLQEGEIWMRRVAALRTGDVRVYRFFCLANH